MDTPIIVALITTGGAVTVGVLANWKTVTGWWQNRTQGENWKSEKVAVIQLMLRSAGHDLVPDGISGSTTIAAIQAFQRKQALATTGRINAETHVALSKCRNAFEASQKQLVHLGYPLVIDGLCGKSSSAVLSDFQQKHGLKVTGLPDATTRRRIEEEADAL